MREREVYIREQTDRLFQYWLIRGPFLGAAIFMFFSLLDYVAAREHFALFFRYRLAIALLLALAGLCGTRIRRRPAMYALAYLSVFASALVIEAMILKLGGHRSSYYPGMIVLGIAIFGIFPAPTSFHVASGSLIYCTYLLPVLALDRVEDVPYFAGANIFIVGVFATAIVLRHHDFRTLRQQIGLQFDLEQHRAGLEEEVRARTAELSAAVSGLEEKNRAMELAEQKLTAALEDWRTTFDASREMVILLDIDLKIRKLNAAAADYLGRNPKEALGLHFPDLFGECRPSRGDNPLERVRSLHAHAEGEIHVPERDDWFMAVADPVFNDGGALVGVVHMLHPINDIKQMQEQILAAKAEWEETFDVINDAITIHDSAFRIIRANRAAADLLGGSMEKVLSRPCFELYHGSAAPPAACPSCGVRDTGEPCSTEIFEPHLGKYLDIKALPKLGGDGKVAGLVHVVRDITARKDAERHGQLLQSQLQHAQKMESIGRLAGGVAHDFNNILFAMLGYTELAISKLPDGEKDVRKHLKIIQESGERAAALNRQLLAFSRKQVLVFQPVSPRETIQQMGSMLERLIGENYTLRIDADLQSRAVLADEGQLEQIIMNLVVNARDAMEGGGEITVSARDVDLRKEHRNPHGTIPAGRYVQIDVIDSGCGMTMEVQEHIFEPFYTTKKTGEGSGLGLSTVYGIVQQHKGFVSVKSAPQSGTTMTVFLPSAQKESADAGNAAVETPAGGDESILVVEDEPHVRQLVSDVLEPLGYTLLLAEDGRDALKLITGDGLKIDLLLTDVVMPGMNGWEFSKRFREQHPEAKVIFMSGYTDDIITRHGVSTGEEALLQKPIRPSVLARVVRETLDGICHLKP